MSAVQVTIIDFLSKRSPLSVAEITLDSTMKDVGIDSLDAVQIVFDLEDHYGITISDRSLNIRTDSLRELVGVVERLVAERPAAAASDARNALGGAGRAPS